MRRLEFLQEIINRGKYQRFIEIGTYKGKTFLPLECEEKIAVDPKFKISPFFFTKWIFKNPGNWRNQFYQMSSEKFFYKKAPLLKDDNKSTLVFIDGLHTFEGSLKDVLNSIKYFDSDGLIVLHDCFPPDEAAATPAESLAKAHKMGIPGWTGSWCGDVWKTIVYLKRKYPDALDAFVFNMDSGLGVVRIKSIKTVEIDEILFNEVNKLNYSALREHSSEWIGLRQKKFLRDFWRELDASV